MKEEDATDREQLIIRLISAVMANVTIKDLDNLNINLSVAMEMVDKVLVEFEILRIRRRQ